MIHAEMFAFDLVEVPRCGQPNSDAGFSRVDKRSALLLFVFAAALTLFLLATRVEAFFLF